MKWAGKIVLCLAGGLVLNTGTRADDGVSASGPYGPIVTRNIFSLVPVPAGPPVDETPPPKITLTGIMGSYGQFQALFKVAGVARPGEPARDVTYILGEGQAQDDVEVKHINDKASVVTFDNHGTVQDVQLANAPTGGTSGPGPGGPGARPMGGPGARFGHGAFGGPNRGPGPAGNGYNNGGNQSSASPSPGTYSPTPQPAAEQQNTLSPEAQMILIAAQHAKYQSEGNPIAPLFPPTLIDTEAGVIPTEPKLPVP